VIIVWNVASGKEVSVFDVGERPNTFDLQFLEDGTLLSMSESGLYRWNVETGERGLLYGGNIFRFSADAGGRRIIMVENDDPSNLGGRVLLLDLESGVSKRLGRFGEDVVSVALDPTGSFLVTGDLDGEVRAGLVAGGGPHLFLGHESSVWGVAIDPLGRWIASNGSEDLTIRLWPMPDLSKPPLHTLPRDELIAKLKTLTNLRVVRDEESSTGWTLTHDPFPGWETVPTW
jgi:WD40 repeat protein